MFSEDPIHSGNFDVQKYNPKCVSLKHRNCLEILLVAASSITFFDFCIYRVSLYHLYRFKELILHNEKYTNIELKLVTEKL